MKKIQKHFPIIDFCLLAICFVIVCSFTNSNNYSNRIFTNANHIDTVPENNYNGNNFNSESFNKAMKEPVIIEKFGEPIAVIISYEHYIKLEDAYWGERAIESDKDKSIGKKKSAAFLAS